jgi:hypothetical protein
MLDWATVGLAIIPPTLALAVERLNPINEAVLRNSVERDLTAYQNDENQVHLFDDATALASSAVEVSGLAPTLVASVTSGFAILHEYPYPLWPSVFYVLTFIVMVLMLLRLLGGRTFQQIDTTRPEISFWGRDRTLPWTVTKTVSYFIYASNLALIFFAVLSYCILEQPWKQLVPSITW